MIPKCEDCGARLDETEIESGEGVCSHCLDAEVGEELLCSNCGETFAGLRDSCRLCRECRKQIPF